MREGDGDGWGQEWERMSECLRGRRCVCVCVRGAEQKVREFSLLHRSRIPQGTASSAHPKKPSLLPVPHCKYTEREASGIAVASCRAGRARPATPFSIRFRYVQDSTRLHRALINIRLETICFFSMASVGGMSWAWWLNGSSSC